MASSGLQLLVDAIQQVRPGDLYWVSMILWLNEQ